MRSPFQPGNMMPGNSPQPNGWSTYTSPNGSSPLAPGVMGAGNPGASGAPSTPGNWGQGGAGWGAAGAGLGNLFSMLFGKNPGEEANNYLSQIQGQTSPLFQPWMSGGQDALKQLMGQLGPLLNNPGQLQNQMGQGFQQSPGYEFAKQQATGAANNAAAAGGYLGTPKAQQEMAGNITGLANQDYNNWMQRTLGLYGQGLGIGQGISQQGLQGASSMADIIKQALESQASASYASAQQQNSGIGSLFGSLGTVASMIPW